jgi:membrane protein DedA with SNARE-associated domain
VVIAGVLGNVAGSYVAWAVGKYAGQAAVSRWGRRVGIRKHEVDRAVGWFDRHGPAAVFFGRLVPVIRTFISLPAGFANMPAGRFGLYTTLGCIPWTAALGIAGYALGANWQSVANDFHGPTYAIAGVVIAAVVVAAILHFRRRGRRGAPDAAGPARAYAPRPSDTNGQDAQDLGASRPQRPAAGGPQGRDARAGEHPRTAPTDRQYR